MKKIISLVLSLTIAIGVVCFSVSAETVKNSSQIKMGENIIGTYSNDGKTLTVSGSGEMYQIESESGGYVYKDNLPYKVNESVEKVVFNGNITYISDYAFYGTSITEFTIPESVKSIGANAFANCEKLVKVDLGNNIETIGYSAFSGSGIKEIKLPKSLKYFGYTCDDAQDFVFNEYGIFSNCKNLETLDIGECTAQAIANFNTDLSTCNNLKNIKVDNNNKKYSVKNGVLFNKNKTELYIYNFNLDKKSYTIPKTVKTIGYAAFFNQKYLRNIKWNKKVKTIKKRAFSGSKIKSITIPNTVTKIDSFAFENCANLKKIKLSENIKNIYAYTFGYCSKLKKIVIPSKVKCIAEEAFSGCSSLSKVVIKNSKSVPVIENEAFSSTTSNMKFCVKNKVVANKLKTKLKKSGVKKAKIYVGKKLIYKNINK